MPEKFDLWQNATFLLFPILPTVVTHKKRKHRLVGYVFAASLLQKAKLHQPNIRRPNQPTNRPKNRRKNRNRTRRDAHQQCFGCNGWQIGNDPRNARLCNFLPAPSSCSCIRRATALHLTKESNDMVNNSSAEEHKLLINEIQLPTQHASLGIHPTSDDHHHISLLCNGAFCMCVCAIPPFNQLLNLGLHIRAAANARKPIRTVHSTGRDHCIVCPGLCPFRPLTFIWEETGWWVN